MDEENIHYLDRKNRAPKLRIEYNQIPLPTICVDQNCSLLSVNKNFLELIQCQEAEIESQSFLDFIYGDDLDGAKHLFKALFINANRLDWDCRIVGKRGSEIWVNLKATLDDSLTGTLSACVVVTDISSQREIERQNHEALKSTMNASRSKNEFLANLSHELRTPLSAISGYSQLLLEEGLRSKEANNYLSKIDKNAYYLSQLVGDVLDLAKIETGKLEIKNEACKTRFLFEDILTPLRDQAAEKNLTFHTIYAGELPRRILTDPTRVKQIITNLVGNAIKFTEAGKIDVTITAKADESIPDFFILGILVRDTGIGLNSSQREKLFKLFSQADSSITRRFGGTGLGLRLSRSIAKKLGGNVTLVSSQPKIGSTFRASIRVKTLDLKRSHDPNFIESGKSEAAIISAKILLVEDCVDLQQLMKHYLSEIGKAIVDNAENGQVAVQLALRNKYDIILMDMQMPVMGGLDATRSLRKQGCTTPIIALSASALKEDVEEGMRAGCNGYLTKPILPKDLIKAISKHLVHS